MLLNTSFIFILEYFSYFFNKHVQQLFVSPPFIRHSCEILSVLADCKLIFIKYLNLIQYSYFDDFQTLHIPQSDLPAVQSLLDDDNDDDDDDYDYDYDDRHCHHRIRYHRQLHYRHHHCNDKKFTAMVIDNINNNDNSI